MKKLIHDNNLMLLGQQASAALRSGWFWAFLLRSSEDVLSMFMQCNQPISKKLNELGSVQT